MSRTGSKTFATLCLAAGMLGVHAGEYGRIEADVSALPEASRMVGRLVEERVRERVPEPAEVLSLIHI